MNITLQELNQTLSMLYSQQNRGFDKSELIKAVEQKILKLLRNGN